MATYVRKIERYDAFQWHPQPSLKTGKRDRYGVEYTPFGFILHHPDASPVKIRPGFWIVTTPRGDRIVYSPERFAEMYEPLVKVSTAVV